MGVGVTMAPEKVFGISSPLGLFHQEEPEEKRNKLGEKSSYNLS
jgi:hypothetical protein